jgi:hypothetical protein
MVNVAGYVLVFFLLERPIVAVDPAEPPEAQINSVWPLGSEKNGLPPKVTKAVAVPVFLISKEVGGFDSVQFPPVVSSLMVSAFGLKTAVEPWPLIFEVGIVGEKPCVPDAPVTTKCGLVAAPAGRDMTVAKATPPAAASTARLFSFLICDLPLIHPPGPPPGPLEG